MQNHIVEIPDYPNENEYPDGIDNPIITETLKSRGSAIWSHGYQLEVGDGIWYELITKDNIPGVENDPEIADKETDMICELRDLYSASDFNLQREYGDNSYFTIHVYNKETVATLDLFITSIESIYGNSDQTMQEINNTYSKSLQSIKDLIELYSK
tara:strand:- start:533 stop:1000 length:468 start_codon:yes stop_codon:yes gene_type:complete